MSERELSKEELEQAAGGLKSRRVNEPLLGEKEPLKVRQSDAGSDPDPGHTDP